MNGQSGATRRVAGWLGAVLVGVLALAVAPGLSTASATVSATECGDLEVAPRPDAKTPALLLTMPSSLGSATVPVSAVSVVQKRSVRVESVKALKPSKLDVAIVLDTAAEAPEAVYRRARALVTALVDSLPARVRVTVLSAGGTSDVLSPLGTDRAETQDGILDAPRGPGHAWMDGIVHASNTLPDNPDRVAQVVVVTTGPDDASARSTQHVPPCSPTARSLSASRLPAKPADQVLGGSSARPGSPARPRRRGRCSPQRVAGRYLAVAPAADLALPLTVRVRNGSWTSAPRPSRP